MLHDTTYIENIYFDRIHNTLWSNAWSGPQAQIGCEKIPAALSQ